MADVKYIITADSKGAVKSINQVDKSIDGMKKQADKSRSPLKGMFKQIALGVGSVIALRAALRGAVRFMGDAIEKAKLQEKAETQLAAALSTTGRNVSDLLPKLKDHASAIQRVTTFGDEAVLSASSLITQLTKLDEEGLRKATEGAVGMAAVFDQDLNAAATLVAKALAGNIGALSRYGIQVDQNLTMEEKRASILEQLSTMYQRAQEETDTFTGRQEQLSNVYGDLKEAIGDNIIKSGDMRDMLIDVREWIEKNKESISLYFSALIEGAIEAVKFLGKVAKSISSLTNLVGASDKEWRAYVEGQVSANSIMQEGVNVMKLKKTAMEEGILKAGEWAGLWKKYGNDYSAMMKAIAEGKEGEDFKQLLEDTRKKQEELSTAAIDTGGALENNFAPSVEDATKKTKSLKDELGLTFKSDLQAQIDANRKALELYGDELPIEEAQRLKDEINELNEKLGLVAETAIPAGRNLMEAFTGQAIPAARDLNDVFEQAPDKLDDIVFATEEMAKDTTTLWGEMTDGLKTKWGSMFGDFLSGAKSFEKEYGDIWGALKTQFFDIVGQMLAKFTTGFLDKIVGKAADAGAGLLDNLFGGSGGGGGSGGSGGGGILGSLLGGGASAGGIWTGIGAAAGNLLGSLITGNKQKGAIDATNRELHNIWIEARHIYQDQAHILKGMDIIKWPVVEIKNLLKGGLPASTQRQAKEQVQGWDWLKADIKAIKIRSRIRNQWLSKIAGGGKITVNAEPTFNMNPGAGGGANAELNKALIREQREVKTLLQKVIKTIEKTRPINPEINIDIEAADAESFEDMMKRGGYKQILSVVQDGINRNLINFQRA